MQNLHRLVFLLMVPVLLSGCDRSAGSGSSAQRASVSAYAALLSRFPLRTFDTLAVYSNPENYGGFTGIPLDSAAAKLLRPELDFSEDGAVSRFFAISKFPIDADRTGLLVRMPSEYESSAVHLFVYNSHADSIREVCELADSWGDAGYVLTLESWLFFTREQRLQGLVSMQETMDNSWDSETDSSIEIISQHLLLDFSGGGIDTVIRDPDHLKRLFPGQLSLAELGQPDH